jgi:glutathione S-transferase
MKLYYAKGACSLAVRIVIHELRLNVDFESVNLQTKKTETGKDFLAINPKGVVPVLITDDNQTLTENAAIQQYLADTQQATRLLPALGDFKRFRVLEWLNCISTDLHKGCSPLFISNLPNEIKEQIFIPRIKKTLAYVEKYLNQKNFLVGEDFTLPDGYLFVILSWMPRLNISMTEYVQVNRYFEALKKRETIQRALKEEGLL